MDLKEKIGVRITQLRKEKKLSQQKFMILIFLDLNISS
jgi:transcriptional regulator with XRE-family HTH domain